MDLSLFVQVDIGSYFYRVQKFYLVNILIVSNMYISLKRIYVGYKCFMILTSNVYLSAQSVRYDKDRRVARSFFSLSSETCKAPHTLKALSGKNKILHSGLLFNLYILVCLWFCVSFAFAFAFS